jgi:hypothetical protein
VFAAVHAEDFVGRRGTWCKSPQCCAARSERGPDRRDSLGALWMAGGTAVVEKSLVLDNGCLALGGHCAAWYLRVRKAARCGFANPLHRLPEDC